MSHDVHRQRRQIRAVADTHQQQVAVLHLDHRLQHVAAVEQLRGAGRQAGQPRRHRGQLVGAFDRHVLTGGHQQPVGGHQDRVRDAGHLAGELGHQPVERVALASDGSFAAQSSLDLVSRACERPACTPPKWLPMLARTASGSRGDRDRPGVDARAGVVVGSAWAPPLRSVPPSLAVGRGPGTSRAPGWRTGRPSSVCWTRRALLGRGGRRPAVVPHRLPVQVGAVGQFVRIVDHLRQHPLVDHVVVSRVRTWVDGRGGSG